MKTKSICILLVLLFCLSLCACGMDKAGNTRPSSGMDILPETSPMISPDRSDGVVTDKDGVIGNADAGVPGASPTPAASPSPSPSQSGTMPTTAPSASPKP